MNILNSEVNIDMESIRNRIANVLSVIGIILIVISLIIILPTVISLVPNDITIIAAYVLLTNINAITLLAIGLILHIVSFILGADFR